MKSINRLVIVLLMLGNASFAAAEIKEIDRERGGRDLQNVHDRVLCIDGLKVLQTIVFGFVNEGGGAAVSNLQLMEENNGALIPARCKK
jgi:hypothetical protein